MIKLRKFFISFYIITLVLWIGLSLLRSVNNIVNFVGDFRLIPMSEEKRKAVVYGSLYDFCMFVKDRTSGSANILFLSSGAKPFYFCRYQLYPRKLYFARSIKEVESMMNQKHYNYLLIYRSSDPLENENNSSQWDLDNYKAKNTYKNNVGAEGRIIPL